jgi:hypothetical protein
MDVPEVREWLESADREMLPMMEQSQIALALYTGKIDAKLCLEIGAAVLYDKPIVIMATHVGDVPANLAKCAAKIVCGDPLDPITKKHLADAVAEIIKERQ